MEYKLDTTGHFYRKECLPVLEKHGFTFELITDGYRVGDYRKRKCDVPINIESLNDIEKLESEVDGELIISIKDKTIEIYDDYRE